MSDPKTPTAVLTALLTGLSTGTVKIIDLELDPSRSFDEQLGEIEAHIVAATEKAAAEHRETCGACREKHEQIMQAQKKVAGQTNAIREDTRVAGFHPALNAQYGAGAFNAERMIDAVKAESIMNAAGQTKPVYHEIGFMAFVGDNPVRQSFQVERANVEAAFSKFINDPGVAVINRMVGIDVRELAKNITIRPVYDKR